MQSKNKPICLIFLNEANVTVSISDSLRTLSQQLKDKALKFRNQQVDQCFFSVLIVLHFININEFNKVSPDDLIQNIFQYRLEQEGSRLRITPFGLSSKKVETSIKKIKTLLLECQENSHYNRSSLILNNQQWGNVKETLRKQINRINQTKQYHIFSLRLIQTFLRLIRQQKSQIYLSQADRQDFQTKFIHRFQKIYSESPYGYKDSTIIRIQSLTNLQMQRKAGIQSQVIKFIRNSLDIAEKRFSSFRTELQQNSPLICRLLRGQAINNFAEYLGQALRQSNIIAKRLFDSGYFNELLESIQQILVNEQNGQIQEIWKDQQHLNWLRKLRDGYNYLFYFVFYQNSLILVLEYFIEFCCYSQMPDLGKIQQNLQVLLVNLLSSESYPYFSLIKKQIILKYLPNFLDLIEKKVKSLSLTSMSKQKKRETIRGLTKISMQLLTIEIAMFNSERKDDRSSKEIKLLETLLQTIQPIRGLIDSQIL